METLKTYTETDSLPIAIQQNCHIAEKIWELMETDSLFLNSNGQYLPIFLGSDGYLYSQGKYNSWALFSLDYRNATFNVDSIYMLFDGQYLQV